MRFIAKRYPWAIPVLTLIGLIASVSEGLGISMFVPFLNTMMGTVPQGTGSWYLDVLNALVPAGTAQQRIVFVGAAMFLCVLFKSIVAYSGNRIAASVTHGLLHELRAALQARINGVSVAFLDTYDSGSLLTLLTTQCERGRLALGTLNNMLAQGTYCLVSIALLMLVSWRLTVLVFALVAGVLWFSNSLARKASRAASELAAHQSRLNLCLKESIDGAREIRNFVQEERRNQKFSRVSDLLRKTYVEIDAVSALVGPVTEALGTLVLCTVLFVAVPLASGNYAGELPKILTFTILLYRLQPQLKAFHTSQVLFSSYSQALSRLDFIAASDQNCACGGTISIDQVSHSIEFRQVGFAYPASPTRALDEVTFEIPANQTTALVGPSGAGKTTVVNLLARFYDATQGAIAVDGVDIRTLDMASWRTQLGIVSQHVFLFDGSVEDNIAFGCDPASHTDVVEAARQANAHDFISALPQGYATPVGENGLKLSGGQRQRIALARALLSRPSVLVLDEATSALDSLSEHLVQEALALLAHRRHILVIAHRLSTIQQSDRVIVLDQGHVVQQGSPMSLLSVGGLYAQLYQLQTPPSGWRR